MQFSGPGGKASPSTPLLPSSPPFNQTKRFDLSIHFSIYPTQPNTPLEPQEHPKQIKTLIGDLFAPNQTKADIKPPKLYALIIHPDKHSITAKFSPHLEASINIRHQFQAKL